MLFRSRQKQKYAGAFLTAGSLSLVVAFVWRFFIARYAALSEDVLDMGTGMLYGITIACYIKTMWLMRNRTA